MAPARETLMPPLPALRRARRNIACDWGKSSHRGGEIDRGFTFRLTMLFMVSKFPAALRPWALFVAAFALKNARARRVTISHSRKEVYASERRSAITRRKQ
jgi:hypothetical protein